MKAEIKAAVAPALATEDPTAPAMMAQPPTAPEDRGYQEICRDALGGLAGALVQTGPNPSESAALSMKFEECLNTARSHFQAIGKDDLEEFDRSDFRARAQRLAALLTTLSQRQPPQRLQEICKQRAAGTLECAFKLLVPPNTSARVPPSVLAALPAGLVTFNVSFRAEDTLPSYPKGYFATTPNPPEPESRFGWNLTGKVGFTADPDPDSTPNQPAPGQADTCTRSDPKCDPIEPYSSEHPYTGERRSRFTGGSTLQLNANLGNRALAQVDFTFKTGDLAGVDRDGQTKVSKYTIETFSLNGLGLRLGKYTLANPASGIAVNETGEGFELLYKSFSLGYIAKRESLAFETDGQGRRQRSRPLPDEKHIDR